MQLRVLSNLEGKKNPIQCKTARNVIKQYQFISHPDNHPELSDNLLPAMTGYCLLVLISLIQN